MEDIVLVGKYTYVLLAFGLGLLVQYVLALMSKEENKRQLTSTKNAQFESQNSIQDGDENHSTTPDFEHEWKHISYKLERYNYDEMIRRAEQFYHLMNKRRSVRFFSNDPVPHDVINAVVQTAGTSLFAKLFPGSSPSGAHCQPWTFVVISNSQIKSEVRKIVEKEEKENYGRRMGKQWVCDLMFADTTWSKPYLETAPYLIVVFKQMHSSKQNGDKRTHYYTEISASIASGILLAAIHNAGLVTLTSTPLNAGPELRALLKRPQNEKVLLLLPIGFPAEDATVPDLQRKPLDDIMVIFD